MQRTPRLIGIGLAGACLLTAVVQGCKDDETAPSEGIASLAVSPESVEADIGEVFTIDLDAGAVFERGEGILTVTHGDAVAPSMPLDVAVRQGFDNVEVTPTTPNSFHIRFDANSPINQAGVPFVCTGEGSAEIFVELRVTGSATDLTDVVEVTCTEPMGTGGGGVGGDGGGGNGGGGNGGGGNGGGGDGGGGGTTSALPSHTVVGGTPTYDADGCVATEDPAYLLIDAPLTGDQLTVTLTGEMTTTDTATPEPTGEVLVGAYGQLSGSTLYNALVGGWSLLDVGAGGPASTEFDVAPVPGPFTALAHPFEIVLTFDRPAEAVQVSSPHVGDDTILLDVGSLGAPLGDRWIIAFANGRICSITQ